MPSTKPISIRVPFATLAQIKAAAKAKNKTLTAFLLEAALKEINNGD